MKISVQQAKGNEQFPRYVLCAENDTYFDGTGWTPNEKKAQKWASLRAVKDAWKKLQEEMDSGLIELTGSFVVRITGLADISDEQIEALAWFLSAASSFTLNYKQPRPTGLENANISTQIVWATLEKKRKSD